MLKLLLGILLGLALHHAWCYYGDSEKLGKYLPKCKCNKK